MKYFCFIILYVSILQKYIYLKKVSIGSLVALIISHIKLAYNCAKIAKQCKYCTNTEIIFDFYHTRFWA